MASFHLLRNLASKLKPTTSFPNSNPKTLPKITTLNRWITTTTTPLNNEDENGKMKPMTMEELEKLPEDTIIHVPKGIPVRFTVRYNNTTNNSSKVDSATKLTPSPKIDKVEKFKEMLHHNLHLENPVDCLGRNILRLKFWNHIQEFGSLESLLGHNVVFLQLVLVDEDRETQRKLHQGYYRQNPKDPNAAQNSKCIFKALVPFLLENTESWVYSRSLVIPEYNRAMLDETLLKFISYDPVGGLKDIPFDIQLGTPVDEVSKQQKEYLFNKAVEAFQDKRVPLGIHCAEIFLKDDDRCLNSRGAVQEFLGHLMTENSLQKIVGFDEMTSGCPIGSPEKIAILKVTE